MTTEEMIAVMNAYMHGATIQARDKTVMPGCEWFDVHKGGLWNWVWFDYRIKPAERKPREWWLFTAASDMKTMFATESKRPNSIVWSGEPIRVREVIE